MKPQTRTKMDNQDAILELLAKEPVKQLQLMSRLPVETVAASIRKNYLPDEGPTDLDPDSQDASEASTVATRNQRWAATTWRQLSETERKSLLKVFVQLLGQAGTDELQDLLRMT